jgi:hypothetical protein
VAALFIVHSLFWLWVFFTANAWGYFAVTVCYVYKKHMDMTPNNKISFVTEYCKGRDREKCFTEEC